MLKMILFEIKKIFSKASNRIAMLLLLITLIIVSYFAIDRIDYVNDYGETEKGIQAVQKLKAAKQEWAGALTEEKLIAVIEENARIIAAEEYQSDTIQQSNIAYGWGQGISDIREMLNRAFCDFREYDYYRVNSLTAKDARSFYHNRILHLKEWVNTEAKDQYSQLEKEFMIHQYETLKTPYLYGYADGWNQLFTFAPSVTMITMLILGFLVTGIFSSEFTLKADAIFFSAYYGRDRAVTAKIKAGILLVTVIYWSMMVVYTALILGILGADGGGLAIQTSPGGWKSLYHLTNLQEFLLVLAGGYVGCLFIALLTMLVSAKTKNSVLAVLVPFVLIFIPSFLSGSRSPVIGKIMGLLPDQLLQMNQVISLFHMYEIGQKVILSAKILFVLYPLFLLLLGPILYRVYKKAEIK